MSVKQYIEMVKRKAGSYNVRQMAIDRIGLDEPQIREIAPIILSSFVYDDKAMYKYGESNFVQH